MQLIKFEAVWCAPCKMYQPQLDKLSNDPDFAGVEFVKYDAEEDVDLAIEYKITSVPTVVLVDDNGQEVYRTTGVKAAAKLKAELLPFME